MPDNFLRPLCTFSRTPGVAFSFFFLADFPGYFLAAYRHIGRSAKPQLYPIATHFQHGYLDVAVDYNDFASSSSKNQHGVILLPPNSLPTASYLYATGKKMVH